jgi:hypothetical protein
MDAAAMKEAVEGMMNAIALRCVANGTYLIGHIKSIAEIGDGSWIASSVTDLDGKVRSSGAFNSSSDRLEVVINALQYGLKLDKLETVVKEVVMERLSLIGKVEIGTSGKGTIMRATTGLQDRHRMMRRRNAVHRSHRLARRAVEGGSAVDLQRDELAVPPWTISARSSNPQHESLREPVEVRGDPH